MQMANSANRTAQTGGVDTELIYEWQKHERHRLIEAAARRVPSMVRGTRSILWKVGASGSCLLYHSALPRRYAAQVHFPYRY